MTGDQRNLARVALATIRTINGLTALVAPKVLLRRLSVDPETNGAAVYALRMFGIRTVLLGAELFAKEGERREEALRTGVLIHASDAMSALLAGVFKQLPRRAAATATIISCVNTCLAVAAQQRSSTATATATAW